MCRSPFKKRKEVLSMNANFLKRENIKELKKIDESLKKIRKTPYLDLLAYLKDILDKIDSCLVQAQRIIEADAIKKLTARLLDEIEIRLAQGQETTEAMEKLVAYLPSLNDCRLTGEEQAVAPRVGAWIETN